MAEQYIPVMGEHENARGDVSASPMGYTPTEEEKKALKLVDKLLSKAKKHRAQYDEHWMDYYKMFRGKQWKETRPSYRHSEVINMIFQNIQSSVPILTDVKPKFDYLPEDPSDIEFAQIMSHVAESEWTRNNWSQELVEAVYDAYIYGCGFNSMEIDYKKKGGLPSICMKSEDPFYQFPDPSARDINKECKYYITAVPTDVELLKAEYPDKKDFIKPDLQDLQQGDKTDLDQVRFKSPVDNKSIVEGTSTYDVKNRNKALKVTCWIKDDEYVEEEVKSGETTKYVQKLKYPNGRKIVKVGGVLLEDGPNQYEDGEFPISRLVNYILPREFWGISDVEQLQGPQKIFNKLVSFALDVLTLMGNPIWIVDNTSGVDTDNLYNRPGLIVEKTEGSEVRREEGVQLQPFVLQLIDRMKSWFDDVSGNNEVSRGVNPTGVTAASAIESLQQAAQQRLRLKARHIDAHLQNLGQMFSSRVMQFKTAPEIYRITNNQNANQYFKFHVETVAGPDGQPMMDEKGQPVRVAKVRDVSTDEMGNQVLSEEKQYQIRGRLDVRVVTGSQLPFIKAEQKELGFRLFQVGAIDEPELLKATDWPNWEAAWERVKERKAQAQQMAAAQQPPQ